MKLRQHRRKRSGIQGKLTRGAVWLPVDFISSNDTMTLRKVRLDLLPPPGPIRDQTYVAIENFSLDNVLSYRGLSAIPGTAPRS